MDFLFINKSFTHVQVYVFISQGFLKKPIGNHLDVNPQNKISDSQRENLPIGGSINSV